MPNTIAELIGHPEHLDQDTLRELQGLVARYPYFQAARLLLLQNLYQLHEASFGDELKRAIFLIPDRKVLFQAIESRHYELRPEKTRQASRPVARNAAERTQLLIDEFLRENTPQEEAPAPRRKLTAADATQDYVAFLLQMDDIEPEEKPQPTGDERSQRSENLINDFIENQPERIVLQETPEHLPPADDDTAAAPAEEDFFTETLAKIYVRQGRYEKALEIIRKLNLDYPKKNRYFADQIRFLQKLIINNQNKSNV